MPNLADLSIVFKFSYALGFIAFWFALLIVSVGLWVFEVRTGKVPSKIEVTFFWAFGITMVAFAAFRPIGIARDDLGYVGIFESICPTLTCGKWLQGFRDTAWYSLVGFLKSFFPDPKVMLWIGAVGLLAKLAVIFSLSRRPLVVLLLYLGLFYQVQDLTAWRASLAISVFMIAIWLIARQRHYWHAWVLFACGMFHKQAFVAPLILVGVFFRKHKPFLIALCLVPVALLLLDIYPKLNLILSKMNWIVQEVAVNQGLDSYIALKNAGGYTGWRNAPIVVYPLILLTLWLWFKNTSDNDQLNAMLTGSLAMGCLFLWAFAYLPDAQVRFFEFFMVPTVLLAGARRLNLPELLGVVIVSGLFVAKYNVAHQLLIQP